MPSHVEYGLHNFHRPLTGSQAKAPLFELVRLQAVLRIVTNRSYGTVPYVRFQALAMLYPAAEVQPADNASALT